jgi:glycosyltransferase EpsD
LNFDCLIKPQKILFVASLDKHIIRFHLPSLKWFKERGYEVHVACNGKLNIPYADIIHEIEFYRSPFVIRNFKALFQLISLFKKESFYFIHCHTPVASVLTRIAANKYRKRGITKVAYTAHGFHFFKGAPWYFWAFFYPIEKYFSRFLDCLITINSEDYHLAKTKFHCGKVALISGMGVDSTRFMVLDKDGIIDVRTSLGLSIDSKILIYVSEFIPRKNHEFLIKSAKSLKKFFPALQVLLPGRGKLFLEMQKLAKQEGVADFVHFLGFRDDVNLLMAASDVAISTSKQEGLGLHLVEAMMCGLPAVATEDRGHKEIIKFGINGYLFPHGNSDLFRQYVSKLLSDNSLRNKFSIAAHQIAFRFELKKSISELESIYIDLLEIEL